MWQSMWTEAIVCDFFFLLSLLLSKFVQKFLSYIKYIVFINLLANQCIALFHCCIDLLKSRVAVYACKLNPLYPNYGFSLSDFSETNLVFTFKFKNKTKPHPNVICVNLPVQLSNFTPRVPYSQGRTGHPNFHPIVERTKDKDNPWPYRTRRKVCFLEE